MKLQLSENQLYALHSFFVDHVIGEKPVLLKDKLIQLHLLKIYKKLRNKVETRFTGKGYSIKLSDEEAIAYYLYFIGRNLGTAYVYEQNFIQSHINQIDKVHA